MIIPGPERTQFYFATTIRNSGRRMAEQEEVVSGSAEPGRIEAADDDEKTPLIPVPDANGEFKPSNAYATKKTVAQGTLGVALLMANASQMTALLEVPYDKRAHYFTALLVLICISVFLQFATGIVLLILGFSCPSCSISRRRADRLNNASLCLIFLITGVNVFITAFGITYVADKKRP